MDLGTLGERRLAEYFDGIGEILGSAERRASFATYALGLLGDGERKSIEPIAARATGDPENVDALHQRLQHFLVDSRWDDRAVRRAAARYAIAGMRVHDPVEAWIFDDTGFLKQGRHSVGVQRQYTGSAGKITNCQIGVSLSVATASAHAPIDFELYLPKSWMDDPVRRREARIPDCLQFQTKVEQAIAMMRRAIADDVPRGVVLADSFYGDEPSFRNEARALGLHYAVGVKSDARVWRVDGQENRRGDPLSVRELGDQLNPKRFRRISWRQGSNRGLHARFAFSRVIPAYERVGDDASSRETIWLVIEQPDDPEDNDRKYAFVSLPKTTTTHKRLIRTIKARWRTERVYQDLKGELGIDHYEGRRLSGWNHHVSVALCCFAFVTAERGRRFPPSARRPHVCPAFEIAA